MALKIQKFECNMFQENCYVVSDSTNNCVIIDCGAFYNEEKKALVDYIRNNNLIVSHLVCTHAHIDHNLGNKIIFDEFGIKAEVPAKDKILYKSLSEQAISLCGLTLTEEITEAGKWYNEDHIIEFGNHKLQVLPTPGHTPGSCVIYCKEENIAFTGDTLFKMSIGRTDFQFGSYTDIIKSLKLIANTLPSDMIILPGHGPQTTIGFESKYNPYLK